MTGDELEARLEWLRREHRALDADVAGAPGDGGDQLTMARIKKRKLRLRDEITRIEALLIPDIIA